MGFIVSCFGAAIWVCMYAPFPDEKSEAFYFVVVNANRIEKKCVYVGVKAGGNGRSNLCPRCVHDNKGSMCTSLSGLRAWVQRVRCSNLYSCCVGWRREILRWCVHEYKGKWPNICPCCNRELKRVFMNASVLCVQVRRGLFTLPFVLVSHDLTVACRVQAAHSPWRVHTCRHGWREVTRWLREWQTEGNERDGAMIDCVDGRRKRVGEARTRGRRR